MRILYVHSSFVPPPADLKTDRFFLLSDTLEGDVLQPVWFQNHEEIEAAFGPGSYPVYRVGRFHYHWCFAWRYKGIRQRLAVFWFYLSKGLELCRKHHYDCIVAYSHMTTGLFAGVLKLLTGGKLVIEIATSPEHNYLIDRPQPTWSDRLMHLYSDVCLHLSAWLCNRAHLLYPQQLSAYPLLRKTRSSVFHEFVPVSIIDRYQGDKPEPFVFMVGAPWFLKGADLLIQAFQKVAAEFPHVKLKIMGYFPDRQKLDALVGGSAQIEILKPRPHPDLFEIMGQAMMLVLPSRSEGMGRVLIEAMAAGVPLLGSDVGGIPYIIRDGQSGLIFKRGDASSLENKLREMLRDEPLRRRMGEEGYRRAHTELNESVYVEQFTRMVKATVEQN